MYVLGLDQGDRNGLSSDQTRRNPDLLVRKSGFEGTKFTYSPIGHPYKYVNNIFA